MEFQKYMKIFCLLKEMEHNSSLFSYGLCIVTTFHGVQYAKAAKRVTLYKPGKYYFSQVIKLTQACNTGEPFLPSLQLLCNSKTLLAFKVYFFKRESCKINQNKVLDQRGNYFVVALHVSEGRAKQCENYPGLRTKILLRPIKIAWGISI